MDHEFLSVRVARLRAEIEKIRAKNRSYFEKKGHRQDEIEKHEQRRTRIVEIKLELEGIMKKKSA